MMVCARRASSSSSAVARGVVKVTLNGRGVDAERGQDGDESFRVYSAPPRVDGVLDESEVRPLEPAVFKARREVHRDGEWHRSVEVWLHDASADAVLVQQRSSLKDTNPGRWDVSCAGHVAAGASVVETALRELDEELGYAASPADLVPIFVAPVVSTGATARHGPYCDKELVSVFLLRTPLGGPQSPTFDIGVGEVARLEAQPALVVLNHLRRQAPAYVDKPPHYVAALEAALERDSGLTPAIV